MSDAESEAYKSMRESERESRIWKEKRKLNPELSSSYDKLYEDFDLMIQKNREEESKILLEIRRIRNEILNA